MSGSIAATLRVLVTPASGVPGEWIAHCLDVDVISQGSSIGNALEMLGEAVVLCVEDDLQRGLDPLDRPEAPEECWQAFERVMRRGRALSDVDPSSVQAVVTCLRVEVSVNALPEHAHSGVLPPAWQIAALENMRRDHAC